MDVTNPVLNADVPDPDVVRLPRDHVAFGAVSVSPVGAVGSEEVAA